MAPKKKKTAVSKDDAQPVGTNSNGASLWQFGPAERVDVPYVLRPFGLNHVVTKGFCLLLGIYFLNRLTQFFFYPFTSL